MVHILGHTGYLWYSWFESLVHYSGSDSPAVCCFSIADHVVGSDCERVVLYHIPAAVTPRQAGFFYCHYDSTLGIVTCRAGPIDCLSLSNQTINSYRNDVFGWYSSVIELLDRASNLKGIEVFTILQFSKA